MSLRSKFYKYSPTVNMMNDIKYNILYGLPSKLSRVKIGTTVEFKFDCETNCLDAK